MSLYLYLLLYLLLWKNYLDKFYKKYGILNKTICNDMVRGLYFIREAFNRVWKNLNKKKRLPFALRSLFN